jgi:hypothetical protein
MDYSEIEIALVRYEDPLLSIVVATDAVHKVARARTMIDWRLQVRERRGKWMGSQLVDQNS